MFYYDSYWHTWSRVLSTTHKHGPYVEVNLTPIPYSSRTWEDSVAPVVIRAHGTTRHERDRMSDELPVDVMAKIEDNIGWEAMNHLLTYDFLPEIDWELYEKHCNGGCAFKLCKLP